MASKFLDQNGLLYFWQKIKNYIQGVVPTKQSDLINDDYTVKDQDYATYKNKVDDLIVSGGEPNVIEGVKVNGTDLNIVNKKALLTIAAGATNGSLAVNGTDVSVTGLGTAAYTNSTMYDIAGSANAVLGTTGDTAGTPTVYGAIASASAASSAAQAAQSGVDAINRAGYQTASDVQSTVEGYGYQTSAQVGQLITAALSGIQGISYSIVQTLPQTGDAGVIYLVSNNGNNPNIYDEYIWVNNGFEKIGTTDVDLSDYLRTSDIIAITNAEIDTIVTSQIQQP